MAFPFLPWLIGGAIAVIAAVTVGNKSSTYDSEYRTSRRRTESKKAIDDMLSQHHEKVSDRQQQLRAAEIRLLEERNVQDRKNLKAVRKRLAIAKSKSEKDILSKQIKFYKSEISKNYRLIASNRKLLTT